MSRFGHSSALWRLLYTYGLPYRGHLAVGLITGILMGGTVFGILRSSVVFFMPLDRVPGLVGKPAATPAAPLATAPPAAAVQTPATPPAPAESRDAKPVDGKLQRLLDWAERLGLGHIESDQRMSARLVFLSVAILLLFIGLRGVATVVNQYCLRWLGARIVVDVRQALLEVLHRQSLSFFGRQDVGHLISRCTYDTARIEGGIASSIADLSAAPFAILGALFFALQYAQANRLNGPVLFFALVAPVLIGPLLIMGRWVKRYSRRALQRVAILVSRFAENLTCIRVVKAYNTEEQEQARFRKESEDYFAMVVKAIVVEVLMGPALELVSVLVVCLFVIVCYVQDVPVSRVFPMALAGFFIYKPVKQLAKVTSTIQRTAAAAGRVMELLDTDTSLPLPDHPVVIPEFRDRIIFDHVDFHYDAGGTQVLHDICLTVPRGSVIAFVGETGSGKTTIVNLLARFYDPTAGRVLVDGHDLRDLDVKSLRRLIGFVTQETLLFNDSIAHNIAYGTPGATTASVEDAARKANAHEFIVAEAKGYDRTVGDKGMLLSGGQRQRIAIARAILKNPPILILDEATSALDTATELLVQEAINRVMADRTVFAIAHRLSTVRHANLICVLDKGRIVERGTHDELYAQGGRYRRLCDLQFR